MSSPTHVQEALTNSLASGIFIDTKFYVFSKRDASGRVSDPRPLYANSHILESVPHFRTRKTMCYQCLIAFQLSLILPKVLSDGFQEGVKKDLRTGFPEDQDDYTDDYDYLSDSDLESINGEEVITEGAASVSTEENRSPEDEDSSSVKPQAAAAKSTLEVVKERRSG
jgi:hypothetical protein